MKKLLAFGFLTILLLTSCSRGYYSHLPRAKTVKTASTEVNTLLEGKTSIITTELAISISTEQLEQVEQSVLIEKTTNEEYTLKSESDSITESIKIEEVIEQAEKNEKQSSHKKLIPKSKSSDGDVTLFTFLIVMAILGSLLLLPVIDAIIFWWEPFYAIFHLIGTLLLRPLAKRLNKSHERKGGFSEDKTPKNDDEDALGKVGLMLLMSLLILLLIANVTLMWWEAVEEVTIWGGEFLNVALLTVIAGAVAGYWFSFVGFLMKIIQRESE